MRSGTARDTAKDPAHRQPDATTPHDALLFYWNNQLHAVRSGRWKLHVPHPYQTSARGRIFEDRARCDVEMGCGGV